MRGGRILTGPAIELGEGSKLKLSLSTSIKIVIAVVMYTLAIVGTLDRIRDGLHTRLVKVEQREQSIEEIKQRLGTIESDIKTLISRTAEKNTHREVVTK